ncbi:MAG: PAS domain S-box protein, partial [Gammaproteobacteria bacterium]|nr:PAS domain S-box protein [Gammaproteobacteria bacterium]
VKILNLGIVAKIDLAELREPFIRSALYILAIVILVSLLGSLLFFYIILPVIRRIKDTEQRFHQLFLNNYTPVLLVDANNAKIMDANKAAIKFYGYNQDELISYKLNVLCPKPTSSILEQLQQVQKSKNKSLTTQHRLHNGNVRDVEILMSPVEINNVTVIYCTIIDITNKLKKEKEHTRLEKDLEQARKMEALGQLTGGIAHDFNNMLGIIMGYTELSREKLSNDTDSKIPGYLEQVTTASLRAKELIASMMLFSRTGDGDYQAIDISTLVKEDLKMLRSIIPTSIEINSHIEKNLPAVLIEPVKLQQLLMNLCVNARDAMDSQGTLTIKLDNRKIINETCLISYERIDGNWVDLSVTDTGSGMSEDVMQHLFEPFFTTKALGKGTGMGMAVVHGIV